MVRPNVATIEPGADARPLHQELQVDRGGRPFQVHGPATLAAGQAAVAGAHPGEAPAHLVELGLLVLLTDRVEEVAGRQGQADVLVPRPVAQHDLRRVVARREADLGPDAIGPGEHPKITANERPSAASAIEAPGRVPGLVPPNQHPAVLLHEVEPGRAPFVDARQRLLDPAAELEPGAADGIRVQDRRRAGPVREEFARERPAEKPEEASSPASLPRCLPRRACRIERVSGPK